MYTEPPGPPLPPDGGPNPFLVGKNAAVPEPPLPAL